MARNGVTNFDHQPLYACACAYKSGTEKTIASKCSWYILQGAQGIILACGSKMSFFASRGIGRPRAMQAGLDIVGARIGAGASWQA